MTTQAEALRADRSDFRAGSPLLSVRDLQTHLLKPASFSLSAGERIAIRGLSGGGKTLLLRAIADLDPSEGVVCLEGRDRTMMSEPEWRRRVGYLSAEPGWWADTLGEHFTGCPQAACIAADLGFPDEAKDWPIARLSTGERLRLALVGALVVGPKALLLDEPTAARGASGSRGAVGHPRCGAGRADCGAAARRQRRPDAGGGRPVSSYIALSYWQLAATSVCVLINAALSVIFGLRVHRSLLFAAIRMVVQLALVGLVLTTLFSAVSPIWTGLAALVMVLFAGHEAAQRQERRLSGWWSYGLGTGCMMMASVVVTVFALLAALRPNPWYDPRYAIPLLGMILGNCMTGVGLGLNTLTTSLVTRRPGVEAQLMLGATRKVATVPVTREALRSALMPIINSMAATGVVSLPGMMTRQILGGVPPAEAVKYQILVMFLIAGGTGLGAVTAVLGGVYRLTDGRHRLRLDRLTAARAA